MWNFQILSKLQFLSQKLKYEIKRGIAPTSLVSLLGLGAANWLVQSAIAPTIAQAYTANVDVSVTRQANESFQTMLIRAEAIARAAVQRSFDRDILVTEVSVMVIGQNEGFIAPILSLKVSRPSWKNRPDPHYWATYYPITQSLLQFRDLQQTTATPTNTTPVAPAAPTTPAPVAPGTTGTPVAPNEPPVPPTSVPDTAPPPSSPPGTNTPPASTTPGTNTPPASTAPGTNTAPAPATTGTPTSPSDTTNPVPNPPVIRRPPLPIQ